MEKHYTVAIVFFTALQVFLVNLGVGYKYEFIFVFFGAECVLRPHVIHAINHYRKEKIKKVQAIKKAEEVKANEKA